MSMKVTNKVHKVLPMQQGVGQKTGDAWQSQDLVLITEERYPKEQAFTFKGANCKKLDNLVPGDLVEVTYEIDSHEHNGRYYTSLFAWEVTVLNPANRTAAQNNTADASANAQTQGNVIRPK